MLSSARDPLTLELADRSPAEETRSAPLRACLGWTALALAAALSGLTVALPMGWLAMFVGW